MPTTILNHWVVRWPKNKYTTSYQGYLGHHFFRFLIFQFFGFFGVTWLVPLYQLHLLTSSSCLNRVLTFVKKRSRSLWFLASQSCLRVYFFRQHFSQNWYFFSSLLIATGLFFSIDSISKTSAYWKHLFFCSKLFSGLFEVSALSRVYQRTSQYWVTLELNLAQLRFSQHLHAFLQASAQISVAKW